MARNRVIYQSEALYVSKAATSTTSADHKQLERVQSANYNFSINRQDINQFGQLARIDAISLDPPTVSLDFSYYLTDGFNERALGFYVQTGSTVQGNFPSGHMLANSGQNFFVTTSSEGNDVTGLTSLSSVIGIGNAYLTDYKLDLAVGSLPTVSVTMEASNINSTGSVTSLGGIFSPAVKQSDGTSVAQTVTLPSAVSGVSTITALRPGDITIDIANFDGYSLSDLTPNENAIHIQSASLSLPLKRTSLRRLGTKFSYARAVDFPIKASLSVKAIVNELTAQNIANVLTSSATATGSGNINSTQTITLSLKGPDSSTNRIIYTLRGCTLDSESFTSAIGSNKSVDLTFSTQIGGPNDLTNGIFVSGANSTVAFT
jgi:hypothetical protein